MTNDKIVNLVADDFQQLEFKDAKTGGSLMYHFFVPKKYDKSKSYPMVLFIHDAGVLSNDVKMALAQCVGAAIWATPSEKARHESFVLAPQYSKVMSGDDYETLIDLIDSLSGQYSIDKNRLYATGQSMGCMNELGISIKYPDIFAAIMLVAGQWDAQATSGARQQEDVDPGRRGRHGRVPRHECLCRGLGGGGSEDQQGEVECPRNAGRECRPSPQDDRRRQ